MDADLSALVDGVSGVVRDRRVVLIGGAARGLAVQVDQLRRLGARDVFVLGIGEGTGPKPAGFRWVALDAPPAVDLFSLLHGQDRILRALPGEGRDALDRFDPAREAVVLAGSWTTLQEIGGRRVIGARPVGWAALEDKTTVGELFDATGVPSVLSAVVPAQAEVLESAAKELDRGLGTVWSGDASRGVNGGGDLVRWIRSKAEASEHADLYVERSERVRVSSFVAGTPCSIHGCCFDDGTAVFRPVEVLSLGQARGRILNAGNSTWWDPAPEHRDGMRRAARALGELLRSRHGYRGAFGLDGVVTDDGFVAVELNPRLSAGFQVLGTGVPELSLPLLDAALRDGVITTGSADLEGVLVKGADMSRAGRGYTAWAGGTFIETVNHSVLYDGSNFQPAAPAESNATIITGPSNGTGFVIVEVSGIAQLGDSIASIVEAGFRYADRQLGSNIGVATPLLSITPNIAHRATGRDTYQARIERR